VTDKPSSNITPVFLRFADLVAMGEAAEGARIPAGPLAVGQRPCLDQG
jgi:hypothetical protein